MELGLWFVFPVICIPLVYDQTELPTLELLGYLIILAGYLLYSLGCD